MAARARSSEKEGESWFWTLPPPSSLKKRLRKAIAARSSWQMLRNALGAKDFDQEQLAARRTLQEGQRRVRTAHDLARWRTCNGGVGRTTNSIRYGPYRFILQSLGMFPLLLSVLSRVDSRGYYNPY